MKKYIAALLTFSITTFAAHAYDDCYTCQTPCPEPCPSLCDMFDAQSSVGFESEFVFRGSKLAQFVFTPSAEVGFNYKRARFYTGFWAAAPFGNFNIVDAQHVTPYGGMSFDLTNIFTLDAGFTYYWFTNSQTATGSTFRTRNTNRQREIYLGTTANVLLNPAFYGFYNIDLEQWVFEPSISESIDIDDWVCLPMSLDFAIHGGYLHAHAFNGNQLPAGVQKQKNHYWYVAGKLDVVYHFNDHARIGVGPRIAYNTDETLESSPPAIISANSLGAHKLMVWWGMNISWDL